MSYCINPACPRPQNPNSVNRCQACGSELILRDRYQIIQPLGKGGFGATFLSKDTSLPGDPICVIKELRPSTTTPSVLEMSRKLFEREAETLGKIGHHPQVPRLLGYFEWKKHFYLVQEYVSGSTLKQEVKKQGLLNQEQAQQFLIEILPVISYIHSQEVIHRDIKPANIIRRSQDGHLVLIDFGAVKDHVNQTHLASGGTGETAFTNISIGTSGFAPPEQMALRPVYASDIYALGVTCIFLLTGKTPNGLGYDQINGEILWRPLVNVSDWFGEILEKMLEVSVRHRFQSAEELLTALKKKEPKKKQVEPTSNNSLNTVSREEPKEPTIFHENENDLSWMSPHTQVAQKIRERKTRIEKKPATQARQMKMRKEASKGYLTTVSPKKTTTLNSKLNSKAPEKWTAATLRSAYVKGRRDFADCNLSRLNLRNAKLSGVNFYGANLYQSDLQGADLSDSNLGHVNLTNTVLKNANLHKAYLSTASLAGCDLRDADLTNAYLNGANLRGANLCGTNLTNAMINEKQIDMAKTNWWTIMPNGKRGSGL